MENEKPTLNGPGQWATLNALSSWRHMSMAACFPDTRVMSTAKENDGENPIFRQTM